MIRADRSSAPVPESLTRPAASGQHQGKTEEQVIIELYAQFLQANVPDQKFSFDFRAYKSPDVKVALAQLFQGKCAYCESRYAGTQPMDVEHFRPKGGVEVVDEEGKVELDKGYPWLAARWTNLLPSCIDCNRPRIQLDKLTGVSEKLGKANQFPVFGPRMSPPVPGVPTPPPEDVPLILDPTVDDPALHLHFHADGIVTALSEKGRHSIRVYALNRAELVFERLGLAQLIEQRLTIIEALARIVDDPGLTDTLRLDLRDLVAHEINALMELTRPDRPFSAMARQLIGENAPLGLEFPPAVHPWPAAVDAKLLQIAGPGPDQRHLTLASQLTRLGFLPHAPASAAYVRWTVTGSDRRVTLYQEKTGLRSSSTAQFAFAGTLPGAVVPQGSSTRVTFPYGGTTPDSVLAVAARFRQWADGRTT